MTGGGSHDVRIDRERGLVVKRFRSAGRGEPAREWGALSLLDRFAPGLAPVPVRADLHGDIPMVVMSLLPGTELGAARVLPVQAAALTEALERLWRAVPAAEMRFPTVTPNPVAFTDQVAGMLGAVGPALGDVPAAALALAQARAWFDGAAADRLRCPGERVVLGHGDPCLANYLWDGALVRLIDFEDSGPSDRAFELAILTEHLSAWFDSGLDAGGFLARFDLTRAEQARVLGFRRLAALFWLLMLRPGSRSSARNPPGTLERQAERLLGLLG